VTEPLPLTDMLRQITDLNIEFREAVGVGDWEAATELETRRRAALQRLFERPLEDGARQKVLNALTELLQSDQALARSLETARDHCSEQITRMQLGRHATNSYRETGMMVPGPKMMQ